MSDNRQDTETITDLDIGDTDSDSQSSQVAPCPFSSIFDIAGIKASQLWMAGDDFYIEKNLIWHFDGQEFAIEPAPATLSKLSMSPEGTLFAIGTIGDNDAIWQKTETDWHQLFQNEDYQLNDIWAVSNNYLFAVGALTDGTKGVIVHGDASADSGFNWQEVILESGPRLAVWADSKAKAYAVGQTAAGGDIWGYDGESWTAAYTSIVPLSYVWGSSATNVWVAPQILVLYDDQTNKILHFDGNKWETKVPITNISGTTNVGFLHGFLDGTVILGERPQILMEVPFMVHQYDGNQWQILTRFDFNPYGRKAIWGPTIEDIYFADNTLVHYNGESSNLICRW